MAATTMNIRSSPTPSSPGSGLTFLQRRAEHLVLEIYPTLTKARTALSFREHETVDARSQEDTNGFWDGRDDQCAPTCYDKTVASSSIRPRRSPTASNWATISVSSAAIARVSCAPTAPIRSTPPSTGTLIPRTAITLPSRAATRLRPVVRQRLRLRCSYREQRHQPLQRQSRRGCIASIPVLRWLAEHENKHYGEFIPADFLSASATSAFPSFNPNLRSIE